MSHHQDEEPDEQCPLMSGAYPDAAPAAPSNIPLGEYNSSHVFPVHNAPGRPHVPIASNKPGVGTETLHVKPLPTYAAHVPASTTPGDHGGLGGGGDGGGLGGGGGGGGGAGGLGGGLLGGGGTGVNCHAVVPEHPGLYGWQLCKME